jgi:hypothetical protein
MTLCCNLLTGLTKAGGWCSRLGSLATGLALEEQKHLQGADAEASTQTVIDSG